MASTVKLRDRDKKRLDELRAKLLLQGISLNQEELLAKLVDLGENFLLIDTLPMRKLSQKKKESILKRGFDLGVTSEETIDSELYGSG